MEKFKIFIPSENISIDSYNKESVVKSVARVNGKHKMNGCNNGGCGICKIKILSGKFTTGKMSKKHIKEKDRKENILLGCKVYPESDLEIEYIGLE